MKTIWNLPVNKFEDRGTVFWDIIAAHFPKNHKLDIIEIGVYKAQLFKAIIERNDIKVATYTGVDPYIGDKSDPYTGIYWKNENEASLLYKNSLKIFKEANFELHRVLSHKFYEKLNENIFYDVVIIDGDHRFYPALWDFHHWFKKVKPGGILIGDDYANSDTPEVTRAVNEFIKTNREKICRMGYRVLSFQNEGTEIPISLTFVYFEKTNKLEVEAKIDFDFRIHSSLSKHILHRAINQLGWDLHRIRLL